MTRSIPEAFAHINDQQAHGPQFGTDECQMQCHLAYDIPTDGTPDATAGWFKARDRHPATDSHATPRGAFNHWLGGSHGHGHVTIARGDGHDKSTDGPNGRLGFWNDIDPHTVTTVWGLKYVGWSWDIDGVSVKPEPPVKTPPTKPTGNRKPHIRAAVQATKIALGNHPKGTAHHHLATALSELLRALGGKP